METPLSWIEAYVPGLDQKLEELADGVKLADKNADKNPVRAKKMKKAKAFTDRITLSGSHVEGAYVHDRKLEKIYVGKVLSVEKHPDADKLVICKVDVGDKAPEPIQIVTGAPNVVVGALVPTVLNGGNVAGGHDGGDQPEEGIRIKSGKLRGVESFGMMCAIEELGGSRDMYPEAPEDGLYIFPADADVKPGDDAVAALGLNDTTVEYEITSNRVDCFSILGMAREAAATFDLPFCPPEVKVECKCPEKTEDYISVSIEDPDLCKRYIARVVKNVKIAPSPTWLQRRLRAQGIRPINNIVDITNYVMEEYGQPMHAFDLDTIAKHQIIVKRAKDGDIFKTLDGVERTLDKDVLMICDGEKEVAIGGIMGGENSMVTDSMTTLLFEAACFDGTNIRLSERRLGLRTDAAGKFEKGLDPNLAEEAIDRACQLIEEMGCGEVLQGSVDVYPDPVAPWELPFLPEKMNHLLGLDVPVDEMLHIFDMLGLKHNPDTEMLTIPTYRQDLHCMADLAEEVARFYGYDRIPSTLTTVNAGIGGIPVNQQIQAVARTVAEANGFFGGMTYSFESPKVFDKLLLPEDHPLRQAIRIINPLGEDFSIMRTTPLSGMLTSLATNYNRRNKNVRLYELGTVYLPDETWPVKPSEAGRENDLPLTESQRLTIGMYGEGDFFVMKGVIEELLEKLNISDKAEFISTEYYSHEEYPYLHTLRQARIVTKKSREVIGYLGQLHPVVAENYGIKGDTYIADIDMDKITELSDFDIKYVEIAKYPASTRDLALLCDKNIYVGDIEKIIRANAGDNLEKCDLFDVYEGENIAEGKKSVAYALSFRATDRNLTGEEVSAAVDSILMALKEKGIEIRA